MSQKVRLRRLRYNKNIRDLFEDTHLRPQDLICPIFVCEGKNIKNEYKIYARTVSGISRSVEQYM